MSAISKYSNYAQFKNVDSKVNAMIAFDKSGTPGQIVGSDGTNGLIWTDSDPSSASYWSEYPATQTVDIADNNIDNVDTIELVNIIDSSGSSGTDTQLLSQNATGALWIDQSDVIEKWSEYSATQTIDASGNDISNVKDVGITGTISNNAKLALNFDVDLPSISMVNSTASMNIQNGSMFFTNVTSGYQTNMYAGNRINIQDTTGTYQGNLQPPTNNNYNQFLQGNGINSKVFLGVSDNNPSVFLSNQNEYIYSKSDLTSLTYNDGTMETVKLDSTVGTLTINDGVNTSVLSTTGLTFSGVPYSRNMVNSSLIYSSAAIYADSTYPPATNLLIRNTYSYSGWAFINTAIGSKFNYYFAPQSPTTTVADIKGISFNYFNVTQTSNDAQIFCTIYTKPQPGDVTFYHSKRNYIFDQSITPTINTPYQACIFVNKSLISYYYETQIQYELDPLNQVGPFLPTEEVLSVTLSSSSSTPAGTMSVVLQKLNIIMDGFTKEFLLVSP